MSIYAVNGKVPVAAWIPSRDDVGNGTTTLRDLVGSNNGTLTNGPTWVADTSNGGVRAINFDGTNDYVSCPSVTLTNALTFSAWARLTSIGGWRTILGQDTNQWAGTEGSFYLQKSNITNKYRLSLPNASNAQTISADSDTAAATNTWAHVVGTYDGASIKFFQDGTQRASYSRTGNIATQVGGILIGAGYYNDGIVDYWIGQIDDIRIFNTALDASDVSYLYNSGNGRGRLANNSTFQMGMPI